MSSEPVQTPCLSQGQASHVAVAERNSLSSEMSMWRSKDDGLMTVVYADMRSFSCKVKLKAESHEAMSRSG